MGTYDTVTEKWDDKILDLEKELENLEREIKLEREKLIAPGYDENLNVKVAITIHTETGGEVDITVVYGNCVKKHSPS